jgi:hypothetical protein
MLKIYCTLSIALLFLFSCKNDFDLTTSWKETTVVYAVLDYDSTVQYLKVYKAFLDKRTSAINIANNPDSLYYPNNLLVNIIEKNVISGVVTKIHTCELVNGDTIPGFQKASGIFANKPNLFYKCNSKLNKKSICYLEIKKTNGQLVTSARTSLVDTIIITRPSISSDFTYKLGFINPSNNNLFSSIAFKSPFNGAIHEVLIRTYLDEKNISTGITTSKSIDWLAYSNFPSKDSIGGYPLPEPGSEVSGLAFYSNLKTHLVAANNIQRTFKYMDIIVYSANSDFQNFISIQKGQNGITSDNAIINFSNLSGSAIGLLASRNEGYLRNCTLTKFSFDSLYYSSLTKALNFKP